MLINIYSLTNPLDGQVFYIGATQKTLHQRLQGHMGDRYGNKRKRALTEKLKSLGVKPIIELLESVHLDESSFYEQWYSDLFKSWGFDLFNVRKSQYALFQYNKEWREAYWEKITECHKNNEKFDWGMVAHLDPDNPKFYKAHLL